MSFRQFIAAFMVLVSLTAQARTDFVCGMSAAAVAAHHCCPPGGKAPCAAGIGEKSCCDPVASSDAPLAHATAVSIQHEAPPTGELPPAFELAIAALIPSAADVDDRDHPALEPDASRQKVRPLYLQTARLRL